MLHPNVIAGRPVTPSGRNNPKMALNIEVEETEPSEKETLEF